MTVWLKTELGKTRCLVNPAHYKHLEMRIPDVSILTMNPKILQKKLQNRIVSEQAIYSIICVLLTYSSQSLQCYANTTCIECC